MKAAYIHRGDCGWTASDKANGRFIEYNDDLTVLTENLKALGYFIIDFDTTDLT